jgi:hypothetical protein
MKENKEIDLAVRVAQWLERQMMTHTRGIESHCGTWVLVLRMKLYKPSTVSQQVWHVEQPSLIAISAKYRSKFVVMVTATRQLKCCSCG